MEAMKTSSVDGGQLNMRSDRYLVAKHEICCADRVQEKGDIKTVDAGEGRETEVEGGFLMQSIAH